MYVIDNTPGLNGEYAAAIVLQNFGCKSSHLTDWYIRLPEKTIIRKRPVSTTKIILNHD